MRAVWNSEIHPCLLHRSAECTSKIVDLKIASDTPEAIESHIQKGLKEADVVISSGGVSMGEVTCMDGTAQCDVDFTWQSLILKLNLRWTWSKRSYETTERYMWDVS